MRTATQGAQARADEESRAWSVDDPSRESDIFAEPSPGVVIGARLVLLSR